MRENLAIYREQSEGINGNGGNNKKKITTKK